jgi:hypothetical protein
MTDPHETYEYENDELLDEWLLERVARREAYLEDIDVEDHL